MASPPLSDKSYNFHPAPKLFPSGTYAESVRASRMRTSAGANASGHPKDSQETPKRHPRDTQGKPKGHPRDIKETTLEHFGLENANKEISSQKHHASRAYLESSLRTMAMPLNFVKSK